MLALLMVLAVGRIQPVLVIVESEPIVATATPGFTTSSSNTDIIHSLPFGGDWSVYQVGGLFQFWFYDDMKSTFYASPSNIKITRSTDNNTLAVGGWGNWVGPDGSTKQLFYSFKLTRSSGENPSFAWRLRPYTAPGVPLQPLTTDVSGKISLVKSLQW